jgi:hypothetical protein
MFTHFYRKNVETGQYSKAAFDAHALARFGKIPGEALTKQQALDVLYGWNQSNTHYWQYYIAAHETDNYIVVESLTHYGWYRVVGLRNNTESSLSSFLEACAVAALAEKGELKGSFDLPPG